MVRSDKGKVEPISGSQNQDFRLISCLLPDPGGSLTLDLGCGIGLYSDWLGRKEARVMAVDVNRENLLRARANSSTDRVVWIRADARYLPFETGVFDTVLSVEVLTHLEPADRRDALGEVGRVAADEAPVYLTLHNKTRLDWRSWISLRAPGAMYETANLQVWPAGVNEALEMVAACGMEPEGKPLFLNFYSRFDAELVRRRPLGAWLLARLEDLCSRMPGLRRAAITFLLRLRRTRRHG